MNGDDPYIDPETGILKNKLGLRTAADLDRHERRFVTARMAEGAPAGQFDLAHLKAIHRHLFQDVYEWAGQTRSVEIAKHGEPFQFVRFIEQGMANVHARLEADSFLRGLTRAQFAEKAAQIVGDVNHAHPFREGNGRTQLQYLKQLAEQAGHPVALDKLTGREWIAASRAANARADYKPMAAEIAKAIIPSTTGGRA